MADYQSYINNNMKKTKKNAVQKLSTDPQSVAARERRHRISNRFKTLQSLLPNASKLDTVSMLELAIQYVKYLKSQIYLHQHQNVVNLNDMDDYDFDEVVSIPHYGGDELMSIYADQQQQPMQPNEFSYPMVDQVVPFVPSSFETFQNNYLSPFIEGSTMYYDGYMY